MAIEKAVDIRRTITIDGQDYLLEPLPTPDLKIPDVSNGAQWNPTEVGGTPKKYIGPGAHLIDGRDEDRKRVGEIFNESLKPNIDIMKVNEVLIETPDAPVLPYPKLTSEVKPEEEVKFDGVKSGTPAGKIPKSVKGAANTNPVYQRPNTRI